MMKAINITSTPPGGERIPISQLVPLDTPLLLQIFPIYACNFRCKYCVFSIDKNKRGFISDKVTLTLSLFEQCVDDCHKFPQKIKVLRFVGMGEPLLHKDLAKMVAYADKSGLFERIEILTNGSLLTKELSYDLIDAGLTKLLISIQGTDAEQYREISHYDIDFPKFLENIQHFHDCCFHCKVHIKIIDCALKDEEDRQRFFDIFGDMCDTIGIENAGPIYPGVEYNENIPINAIGNQYGAPTSKLSICPQSFFSMQINPDGRVVPCYSIDYPGIMGNCRINTLPEIWNGETYNLFRYRMLDGIGCNSTCSKCDIFKHRAYCEDDLTSEIDRLKKYYA
jgi:radical SAM protein with 4Fe4S-binding SPASM domain